MVAWIGECSIPAGSFADGVRDTQAFAWGRSTTWDWSNYYERLSRPDGLRLLSEKGESRPQREALSNPPIKICVSSRELALPQESMASASLEPQNSTVHQPDIVQHDEEFGAATHEAELVLAARYLRRVEQRTRKHGKPFNSSGSVFCDDVFRLAFGLFAPGRGFG